ncbi:MAG: hypothetical protein JXA73_22765 [Acidobacteria bacterium]|nr:hypothetical protein [Acidobacteriota bacterium]
MNSSPLRLKNARNWFAAGAEVQQALEILSDGSFKVFMHICLNAERETGILHTTQVELARNLKKSHGTIRKYLGEMERACVCQNHFSNNPVTRGSVQISPSYWPYERGTDQSPTEDGADRFLAEIRKMLAARACVRPSFSTADEILARRWFNASIPLDRIGQAILLGCARKYFAWRNNQAVQGPISALRYFEPILEEIGKQKLDPDYWIYLRFRIQRQEKLWIEKHRQENGSASKIKEAADESERAESE